MYVCVCVQCHSDCSRCKAPTCCFCCCHGNLAVTLATLRIRHVSHSRQTSQFFNPSAIYRVWPWPILSLYPSLMSSPLCLTWYLHLPCAFSAFAVHANNKQFNLHICLHFGFPFCLSRSLSLYGVSYCLSLSCVFCSDLCSVLGLPYCLLALSPSTDWVQFFSACR